MLIPVSLANLIKAPPKNHSTHGCRAILLHNRAVFGHNTQIISISKKVCCAPFTQNCASFSTLLHLKPRLDPEFSPKTRPRQMATLYTGTLQQHWYWQMLLQALYLPETGRRNTCINRHPSPKTDHEPDIAQYAKASQLLPRAGTLIYTKLTKI